MSRNPASVSAYHELAYAALLATIWIRTLHYFVEDHELPDPCSHGSKA